MHEPETWGYVMSSDTRSLGLSSSLEKEPGGVWRVLLHAPHPTPFLLPVQARIGTMSELMSDHEGMLYRKRWKLLIG